MIAEIYRTGRALEGLGYSLPAVAVLEIISDAESLGELLGMGQIAERLGPSSSYATNLVDQLERIGLVERTRPQSDRRRVIISITKKGVSEYESIMHSLFQSSK